MSRWRRVLSLGSRTSPPCYGAIAYGDSVVSTGARSAEWRDLLSTTSRLSLREGLSTRACGPRSRRRGVKTATALPLYWQRATSVALLVFSAPQALKRAWAL